MTPWHWPSASRRRRRVVRRPSTSCIDVSCVVRRRVARHHRRRHVVVVVDVVTPWHWPSASRRRRRVVRRPSMSCIVRCCASCVVCQRVVVVMSSVDVSSVVIVMRGHVIVGSCVVVSPCRPCVSSVVGHCRRDAVAMGVCVTSSSWVAVSWVRCRGSSSSLCRALWVAVGRRCISAGAENARETYLQATTTCVIDAASTTQVVVGSPSSLGVLGMAVVSSALTGW